jgi:4-amino-4-deoxychorismate lyase
MVIRVLRTSEEILEASRQALTTSVSAYKAFYNSRLGGIITDPLFMTLPADDHQVHRGHAVFDTMTVREGRGYLLDRHIARIVDSATKAKIELPLQPEEMKDILVNLVAASGLRNAFVRYWISAGPGNFAITPVPGNSVFYAVAIEAADTDWGIPVKEVSTTVPPKPAVLAEMKSTNYMLNALCALDAKERGGHLGM